jgi:hypothetical protein
MPEVKNLNNVWLFMDAVINQNKGCGQAPERLHVLLLDYRGMETS